MYRHSAVSIIELILAVVVLGLVAALTLPRFSRAAVATDPSVQLRAELKVLRVAIERYYQDHGAFPGQHGDGQGPGGTEATLLAQLMRFTDEAGRVTSTRDALHRFGPYLRNGLPPCPVGARPGLTGVSVLDNAGWNRLWTAQPVAEGSGESRAGWVYNYESGQIAPNSTAADSAGRRYSSY